MLKKSSSILSRTSQIVIVITLIALLTACVSSGNKGSSGRSSKPKSDKALIHTQLARGYLQQKQYAVAKSELDEALRIDPSHSASNYVMALLMLELKQFEDAERYFERAVKSDRNNSSAAHDFGVFLCRIGSEIKAVEYFEIAVSNPLFKSAELSNMRAGECLAKIGDPKAETYLKNALSANPRLRPALYRLAVIKFDEESYFSARAYIERYFAITKPQPASLLLAYKIESKLNAADVAEKYRTQLMESFPASKEAGMLRKESRG